MADSSAYQVVARKYRPQDFDSLVGQSHISAGLTSAIATNRIGHAYLFTGARGTGKTSTARIFAKALNCQKYDQPTPTPCGECDVCQGVAAGNDIDVIEIDGASHNGVDSIRELRSNAIIRPSRARFKIYIIDEVHMLSTSAFNALLKTLEEPPEHVKFIFCTTEAHKIPITILSRCQKFDFAPVATESIQKKLSEIAANEKVEIEPAALQTIARRAAGSMRDSQSLLEQLLSVSQGRITVEDVHRLLGTARSGRLAELVQQLAARDAASSLASIDAAVREGVDIGQLAEQVVGYLRDMLAASLGASPDIMLHCTAEEYAPLAQTGKELGPETLLAMLQILDQALVRMRQSIHPRVLMEVAAIRICRLEALDDLASLMGQLQTGAVPAPPSASVRRDAPAIAPPASAAPSAATPPSQKKTEVVTPPAVETAAEEAPVDRETIALTPENAREIWSQAVATIGDITADMCRTVSQIATSGPNRLAVSFPAEYTSHKEFCDRPANRSRLEKVLEQITGQVVRIDFQLLPGTPKPVERVAPPNQRQLMKERERHPLVQQTMEVFQAEIVRVEEGRSG